LSFPKLSPEMNAKTQFKARSLQLIEEYSGCEHYFTKRKFNVLLLKAAKTKYIQIHIYAFTVMKCLSTLLKADILSNTNK
jgi:hypothetical protein